MAKKSGGQIAGELAHLGKSLYDIILNADLDCSGKTIALLAGQQATYDGTSNIPDVGFKGIFDGRGHTISNLTTKNGRYRTLGGVFGQICAGAVVKNVAFVNLSTARIHAI